MRLSTETITVSTYKGKSQQFLLPLILITSLFFLWGMAYGLLDVLNKHFQEALNITTKRSTLLQTAYFGAYFLIAFPAGVFMSKFGYKKGIMLGLALYAGGAFLFFRRHNLPVLTFSCWPYLSLHPDLFVLKQPQIPTQPYWENPKRLLFD